MFITVPEPRSRMATRQRDRDGELPGALVIERNVLEWRFDTASDNRLDVHPESRHRPGRRISSSP